MKLFYIIFFLLINLHIAAQKVKETAFNIPVDNYTYFEECCTKCDDKFCTHQHKTDNLKIYGDNEATKILALRDGIIKKIIHLETDFYALILKSDEDFFVYNNIKNVYVKENEEVTQNQIIGELSELEEENYILFEIRSKKGDKYNPIEYLKINQ